jgi:hypothetical protein
MGHVVIAGYVTVETAVRGGRAQIDIPRGTPLPSDVPPEQLDRLLALGDVAEVTVEKTGPAVRPPAASAADGTIAEVLDRVGGDPERALAAWNAEEAKGEKARSTLMRDLAAIVENK